jgi:hypothetical protein
VIAQLAARVTSQPSPAAGGEEAPAALATLVFDQGLVARLVTRSQRAAAPAAAPRPRWLAPLQQSLQHARAGLERAAPRVGNLDDVAVGELQQEVGALLSALESIVGTLAARERAEDRGTDI